MEHNPRTRTLTLNRCNAPLPQCGSGAWPDRDIGSRGVGGAADGCRLLVERCRSDAALGAPRAVRVPSSEFRVPGPRVERVLE
jgi:hypothetical protein